jgi:hypothetical protein
VLDHQDTCRDATPISSTEINATVMQTTLCDPRLSKLTNRLLFRCTTFHAAPKPRLRLPLPHRLPSSLRMTVAVSIGHCATLSTPSSALYGNEGCNCLSHGTDTSSTAAEDSINRPVIGMSADVLGTCPSCCLIMDYPSFLTTLSAPVSSRSGQTAYRLHHTYTAFVLGSTEVLTI